jgi:hypothetical protein
MIRLGYDDAAKDATVSAYCAEHAIRKVFVLSPGRFRPPLSAPHEAIEWAEIIQYRFYYRLLREVDPSTLIVVNECLRTQNRHELTYNCIRLFLQQTGHRIVFQYLPLIDSIDDFMILFDFDTRSRWKREKFRPDLLAEAEVLARPVPVGFVEVPVETDAKTRDAYVREKRRLIDGIGLKDPHTIPRNLHLMAGKARLARVEPGRRYVGRNNRFKLPDLEAYRDAAGAGERAVFEFCHNFIDMADFLGVSRQHRVEALVSDLKVDRWYFDRYAQWAGRIREAYSVLPREEDRP